MDILAILSALGASFIAVFVIVDPFAVLPVYLTMTETYSEKDRHVTCVKATLVGTGILVVFAVTGMGIFNMFGITLPAFQIAGGILLLSLGIDQLKANRARVREDERKEIMEKADVSVFPLGTPLLAGPGAISTVVLLASKAHTWIDIAVLVTSIILALLVAFAMLKGAFYIYRVLGKTGLNLLTRLMGIILTAIAIQFVLNGLKGYVTTTFKIAI